MAERIALTPGAKSPEARYKYGLPKVKDDSYDLLMNKMQAELKELEEEEAELKKSQQLETMHRELEAKRKKVKSLGGKINLKLSEHDKCSKSETNAKKSEKSELRHMTK